MSEEVISVIHAPQSFQNWVRPAHSNTIGPTVLNDAFQRSNDAQSKSSLSNSISAASVEGSSSPPASESSTVVRKSWRPVAPFILTF